MGTVHEPSLAKAYNSSSKGPWRPDWSRLAPNSNKSSDPTTARCQGEDEGKPAWEQRLDGPSPAKEYLSHLLSTTTGQIKYRPLKMLMPYDEFTRRSPSVGLYGGCEKMQCDATMVALGLELFHRRNNAWPARLDELCPALLPADPVDQMDGKPIKYRLIGDKPVVYSVGRNKVDDGGQSVSEDKPGIECTEGDWRLYPIRPEDRN